MSSVMSATAMRSFSPLTRLQNELSSEVNSGAISADDQSALGAALTDIDSQLRAQAPSPGSRPSPGDMKAKINGLIDDEVSSGKLTSAQADELKGVFSNAFKGKPGGPGGPADANGISDAAISSSATNSTDSNMANIISDFLKLLQNSNSSSSTYGSSGNSLAAQMQSLIVNFQT